MKKPKINLPSKALIEDEAVASASTTASVDITDLPLGKKPKIMRREPQNAFLAEKKLGEGLGKPRHCLPQITDYDAFVSAVKDAGATIEDDKVDPDMLEPTQSNFNQEKVDRIVASGKLGMPVVVSKDAYVLDGHHRWLAAKEMDVRLAVRVVSLSIEALHDLCDDADFCAKKKINENMEKVN